MTVGRPLGRFWAIASASDNEIDDDAGLSPALICSMVSPSRSLSYICRTPASEDCDLERGSVKSLEKKEKKRRNQQKLVMEFGSGEQDVFCDRITSFRCFDRRVSQRKLHVLPPTTFLLDNFDAKEWIMIQRRRHKAKPSPMNRWTGRWRGCWRLIRSPTVSSSSLQ
jgi:hypothetical protein